MAGSAPSRTLPLRWIAEGPRCACERPDSRPVPLVRRFADSFLADSCLPELSGRAFTRREIEMCGMQTQNVCV